ncbi:formyltetrahydrofolate deformylase [Meredithblackwellia eburnea MCA 4105]
MPLPHRNFDPKPPACKITFDQNGHAIALSPLEHLGLPTPAPTPMYAGVTANTPRDIMPYRSHPYPQGTDEYPAYSIIKVYQERHSEKYREYIRFGRVVTRVRHHPEPTSATKKWLIEWKFAVHSVDAAPSAPIEEQFDHVVVANGSDSRPFIPYFDGLWNWKGEAIHSRWYRNAETYAGKTVVIVGSGPSSADIVRELGLLGATNSHNAAKKIYRSIRSKPRYDINFELGWSEHIETVVPIKLFEAPSANSKSGRITLQDGKVIDDVDVIIFATAYVVRFEFLRPTDAPFDQAPLLRDPTVPEGAARPPAELVGTSTLGGGHRPHNLDAHALFYLPDPTLAFLLLHAEAIPWPFSEMQARVVASYWSGTPLALEPHPQEDSDSHSVLVLGHPGEFEYAERLLKLIGEGGPEEVDAEGKWGEWPKYKKRIRELID